jgi:hypothetical protein
LEQGRYDLACPKLAESYRIDRSLGALLNLAVCHEREGRVASARAEFVEAAASARRAGDHEREDLARRHAEDLAPKIPRVQFRFVPSTPKTANLELDGVTLLPSAWESPLAVDPGSHTINAQVPGKKLVTSTFVTSANGQTAIVTLGPFEDDHPSPNASSRGIPTRTLLAGATGALGVIGLGLGTYFGIRTFSLKDERSSHCDANNACDPRGLELDSHARDTALVSTISIAAGAALLSLAAVLFFTSPSPTNASRNP